MSISAQLRALVWMIGTAARPLEAGRIGVIDRASGNAVITWNLSVMGCDGYVATTGTDASVPINWPMPLASTTTSLSAWKSQSFRNAVSTGVGGDFSSGGSIMTKTCPP